jgi:predicted nuclease with RNAse H fold
MSLPIQTVVGIDVGGEVKGLHAVALRGETFVDKTTATNPAVIVDWCLDHRATVVSVDVPCGWSQTGSSRLAEQELELLGKKIYCFATPTRERAENHDKGFYDWVFNGENLYMQLRKHYPLFNGERRKGQMCIETFPHAVVCAMAGRVISAKPKAIVRRKALENRGYDISILTNIDFVDAALCAVAGDEFRKGSYQLFGDRIEGFIVVPGEQRGQALTRDTRGDDSSK